MISVGKQTWDHKYLVSGIYSLHILSTPAFGPPKKALPFIWTWGYTLTWLCVCQQHIFTQDFLLSLQIRLLFSWYFSQEYLKICYRESTEKQSYVYGLFQRKGEKMGWVEWVSWFSCFCFSNAKVLHFDLEYLTGYFFCCFNKTPDLSNLKKEGLVWLTVWGVEVLAAGACTNWSHCICIRKGREMDAGAQFVLSFSFHLRS